MRLNAGAECFNQYSLAVWRKAVGSVAEIINKYCPVPFSIFASGHDA